MAQFRVVNFSSDATSLLKLIDEHEEEGWKLVTSAGDFLIFKAKKRFVGWTGKHETTEDTKVERG